MTRQLACMGPRGGCRQGGRTRNLAPSPLIERGETKPLFVSRPAVTGECPLTNTGDFPEDVSKPDCIGKPEARWLRAVGKCVEARGGRVLAESALPASPSSLKG
eukprot:382697-Pyramimonas_sp.AAC.1